MTGIYGEIDGIKYQIDKLDIRFYNIEAAGYEGALDMAAGLIQRMYDTIPRLKHTRHRLYDVYRTGIIDKDNTAYRCFNVIFEAVTW